MVWGKEKKGFGQDVASLEMICSGSGGFRGASWRSARSLGLRLSRKQVGGKPALVGGADVIGSGSGAAADHGFDGLVNLENGVDLILPGPCAASAGRCWALLGAAGVAGRGWRSGVVGVVGVRACGLVGVLFSFCPLRHRPALPSTQHPALQGSAQHPHFQPVSRVAREMECPPSH